MPELGDRKRGRELGILGGSSGYNFQWSACIICGLSRWVRLRKNQPEFEVCRKCTMRKNAGHTPKRGAEHYRWKGGRVKLSGGYIGIKLQPNDFFFPMTKKSGYVLEHRLAMAKHLGRCLHRWEIVHHKHTRYPVGSTDDKQDNRIENLQLVSDDRHKQISMLEQRIKLLEARVTLLEAENVVLKQGNNVEVVNE